MKKFLILLPLALFISCTTDYLRTELAKRNIELVVKDNRDGTCSDLQLDQFFQDYYYSSLKSQKYALRVLEEKQIKKIVINATAVSQVLTGKEVSLTLVGVGTKVLFSDVNIQGAAPRTTMVTLADNTLMVETEIKTDKVERQNFTTKSLDMYDRTDTYEDLKREVVEGNIVLNTKTNYSAACGQAVRLYPTLQKL